MASTIKVDNVQNQPGTNIISKCGTTITLGASSDTVALATGASQTGFGRTGTVDWVTTKKTTGFTAVSGNGYFCDTAASGAFTLTLPTSPSAGDIVGFKDYNGNFATANLTIGRGGQPINGGNAVDPVISTDGAAIFLVYVDASQGWVATQDDSSTFAGVSFLTATGGTITTCGNDKIHTFTAPGTFTVCQLSSTAADNLVSYLVVAGGGGGGSKIGCSNEAGGGGGGGYRELESPTTPYTASPLDGYPSAPNRITVTATGYPIAVGGGGAATVNGVNSTFSTITSAGGGGGGDTGGDPGSPGGSGGGGGYGPHGAGAGGTGGTGNTPPTTPAQGNNGFGGGSSGPSSRAGGGGGAGGTGGPGSTGGPGATTCITASPVEYSEGASYSGSCGAGGANTGDAGKGGNNTAGWAGGSGIVVIRYKFQ